MRKLYIASRTKTLDGLHCVPYINTHGQRGAVQQLGQKMQVLNAKWTEYNNAMNEGGEGYNPHPKYIAKFVAQAARPGAAKMIMGKLRTEADARKFARNCMSGEQRRMFEAAIDAAFPAA